MRKAYVLIHTLLGKEEEVAEALRCRPEVVAADVVSVSGPYDVIAVVEGTDANAVARIILSDLPIVDGVSNITTCLVNSRRSEQGHNT